MIIDDRHRLEFNRDSNYVTIIRISEDVPFACEMGVTSKNGISSENEHREKNWDKNLQKVYEKGATLFFIAANSQFIILHVCHHYRKAKRKGYLQ